MPIGEKLRLYCFNPKLYFETQGYYNLHFEKITLPWSDILQSKIIRGLLCSKHSRVEDTLI